ncbi:DNA uptake protein [Leptolyngbya sp. 'hensonii']|uniref:helix-hairpin-helix domain-containing protein n=1 Tax=Leptolyngbya sp. 'hensonii' TaxID=1922337 RepID=UPI00094F6CB1|nr:ComEA family DNA-binding protein [Leptolyngbya sp. 'hensonii']OLP17833.1 DNA uptake protein [Leptolyngbya sp. 'hensonii']
MSLLNWLSSIAQSSLNPDFQAIKARILSTPYYRLQSATEIQVAATLGIRIDVNRASVDDWLRIPGISIHQARSLVDLTQTGVQFCGPEDVAAALGLPEQWLRPAIPILQFCYYDAASLETIGRVNPSTAPLEDLKRIPGLASSLAVAIGRDRQINGPYHDLADLQRRLSLPGELISQLMHYLRFQ